MFNSASWRAKICKVHICIGFCLHNSWFPEQESKTFKNIIQEQTITNLHHCPSSTSTQAIFISHSLLRFHVPNLLWFIRRDPGRFQIRLEAFEAPGVADMADMVGSSMNRNPNIMAITWCIWVYMCIYIYIHIYVCLNVWIWVYIQTSIMGI
jgi:hypothetical protein